jgi:hypothetical protein
MIASLSWGPVAQRLEQQTHNLLVVGSNPTGPTIPESYAKHYRSRPILVPRSFEQLFAQRFRITMHLLALSRILTWLR